MSEFRFTFSYQKDGKYKQDLSLLKFTGFESLSKLYEFDIELKSINMDMDEDDIVNQYCKIEIYHADHGESPLRVIHGLINQFEDVNYFEDYTLYRAKLVPRIWKLNHFETNEVYLDETIEQTISTILDEAGFVSGHDFRFEFSRNYRKWPFRLQYKETHLDYLQRIVEREGIYYYFEHTDAGDVIVFCDNNQALPSICSPNKSDTVKYQANGGAQVSGGCNTVSSIICKRSVLPRKVTLRDYNDETPSLDIRGEFEINPKGVGDINIYGLNIVSPNEGQALAEIHANALLCRQKSYVGMGDAASMLVGHTFGMQEHPKSAFNQLKFLIEQVMHEGVNITEFKTLNPHSVAPVTYTNTFTALPANIEFAPTRQTQAPVIQGTLNAIIDTEAESQYAELDEHGRYKIKLPFERRDRPGGKASHWVRMMQPYGGAGEGMHFPLRKDTRVLLGFIGGDPDRPFISGTINDSADQKSIVTGENQTNHLIKTASGNKIEMEDKEGKNRIKLETGDNKTYMHLGAPNHPGDGWVVITNGMERKEVTGGQNLYISSALNNNLTSSISDSIYTSSYVFSPRTHTGEILTTINPIDEFGEQHEVKLADAIYGTNNSTGFEEIDTHKQFSEAFELSGHVLCSRLLGDRYIWEQGNEYRYNSPGDKRFNFGADKDIVICQSDGILDTDYTIAGKFASNQKQNQNLNTANTLLGELDTLRETFLGYQCFSPTEENGTNFKKYDIAMSVNEWNDLIDNKSQVRVARHNTFNIQKGNIVDFGGYWTYNLGNSYTETHGTQQATINDVKGHDLSDAGGPTWGKIKGENLTIKNAGLEQVEKFYCDQYTFSEGQIIEVQVGNKESQHFGDSYETFSGKTVTNQNGDSYSYFGEIGKNQVSFEAYYGFSNTLSLAGSTDTHFGYSISNFVGASTDTCLGVRSEFFFGLSNEVQMGYKNTIDTAGESHVGLTDIRAKLNEIGTSISKLTSSTADIRQTVYSLDSLSVGIQNHIWSCRSGFSFW